MNVVVQCSRLFVPFSTSSSSFFDTLNDKHLNQSLIMGTHEKKQQEGLLPTHTPLQPQTVHRTPLITPFKFMNTNTLFSYAYIRTLEAMVNGWEWHVPKRDIVALVAFLVSYVLRIGGLRHPPA